MKKIDQHILPQWYLKKLINPKIKYIGYTIRNHEIKLIQKYKAPMFSKASIFIDESMPYGSWENGYKGPSTSLMDGILANNYDNFFTTSGVKPNTDTRKLYTSLLSIIDYFNISRNQDGFQKIINLIKEDARKNHIPYIVRHDVTSEQIEDTLNQAICTTDMIPNYLGMMHAYKDMLLGNAGVSIHFEVMIDDAHIGFTDRPNLDLDLEEMLPNIFKTRCHSLIFRESSNRLLVILETAHEDMEKAKEQLRLNKKLFVDHIKEIGDLYIKLIIKSANYFIVWPSPIKLDDYFTVESKDK